MTSLHRWACTMDPEDDVQVTWSWLMETYGLDAIERDPVVGPLVQRINGQTALKLSLLSLSRTVQAYVNEYRAVDPATVRRWARS